MHSSGNLFQSFTTLWENVYFLISNLEWLFTKARLCPLVMLSFFILKNISLFNPSYPCIILKTSIWSPRIRLVSRVVNLHCWRRSSSLNWLISDINLVALLCTRSNLSIFFLMWGLQAWMQYSRWGLTKDMYSSGIINRLSLYAIFLLIKPNIWFPFLAAIPHCSDTFMSELTTTPTSFSLSVDSNTVLFIR